MPSVSVDELRRQLREEYPHVARIDDDRAAAREFSSAIRRELRELRKVARLSQADVAGQLGVDQSVVSRIESESGPDLSLDMVFRYARACGSQAALTFVPPAVEKAGKVTVADVSGDTFSSLADALAYRQRRALRLREAGQLAPAFWDEFLTAYTVTAGQVFVESTAAWMRAVTESMETCRSLFVRMGGERQRAHGEKRRGVA